MTPQEVAKSMQDWIGWFNCAMEPITRTPLPRMVAEFATPEAMTRAWRAGMNAWDYQRKLFPDPPICGCGKPVDESRRCYARPTCFACLPPPPPLPIVEPDCDDSCDHEKGLCAQ